MLWWFCCTIREVDTSVKCIMIDERTGIFERDVKLAKDLIRNHMEQKLVFVTSKHTIQRSSFYEAIRYFSNSY